MSALPQTKPDTANDLQQNQDIQCIRPAKDQAIKVKRVELLAAMKRLVLAIDKKPSLPILQFMLCQVKGDHLYLHTTDSEKELQARINVETPPSFSGIHKMTGNIQFTLPAKKLLNILKQKALKDDDVWLQCQRNDATWDTGRESNGKRVYASGELWELRCGLISYQMNTCYADEYPLPEVIAPLHTVQMPVSDWTRGIGKVSYAMAKQDARYYLNGILLELVPGKLNMVATDGHRLASWNMEMDTGITGKNAMQSIIKRDSVELLGKLLKTNPPATLRIDLTGNHVRFSLSNDVTLTAKLADGNYPDYHGVIPAEPAITLTLGKEDLLDHLAAVGIFSKKAYGGVRLALEQTRLGLHTINETGEESHAVLNEEEHAVITTGLEPSKEKPDEIPSFHIGLNISYVNDALKHCGTDKVTLNFTDPNSSVLITETADKDAQAYSWKRSKDGTHTLCANKSPLPFTVRKVADKQYSVFTVDADGEAEVDSVKTLATAKKRAQLLAQSNHKQDEFKQVVMPMRL